MADIVVKEEKVKKDQEHYEKMIIELKGTTVKIRKSSITIWAKVVSQPKNN